MEPQASFDIPLETLSPGVHHFNYEVDDAFFEAFDTELLRRGHFYVTLTVEKIRSQFNLLLDFEGVAGVDCDRCLEPIQLPLEGSEEIVIKYDSSNPREEGEVIFVPPGVERFNVARLIFDTIGISLPMATFHEDANESCDPAMLKYLSEQSELETPDPVQTDEIPADSPWRALQALKGPQNLN